MTRSSGSLRDSSRVLARLVAPVLLALFALVAFAHNAHAQTYTQIDIPGPSGSATFGANVTVLPNGNFVVVDSLYDAPGAVDAGSVSLYDGATLALISRLTGSTAGDQVGSGGITVLANGNFVVASSTWNNGAATQAGAATWVDGALGLSGVVSPVNSLVGSTTDDLVSLSGVTALTNGNYVVGSWQWDQSPALLNVGAVTWGNGATGISGAVSTANSLVGGQFDQISAQGVIALPNGSYAVLSEFWRNGAATNAGAVTWADGDSAFVGQVSAANSLVGDTKDDSVGRGGLVVLPSGNFLVRSPLWDGASATNVGALTLVDGDTGLAGVVSASNSLIGASVNDTVASYGVTILTNGNYVAITLGWDNGATADVGAVTWGNGETGTTGVVSTTNSLVGSTAGDLVGNEGVTALENGNYVVASSLWDGPGPIEDVGAVTWGNGATGTAGVVSSANSLYGSTTLDQIGSDGVTALGNGNYVVVSTLWDSETSVDDVGAVTLGDGETGVIGVVFPTNSLVGFSLNDQVGSNGVTALPNGNYVVHSPQWNDTSPPGRVDAGAVTWGDGQDGVEGIVGPLNSIIGSTAAEQLGVEKVVVLANSNFVVRSPNWNNGGSLQSAGAAMLGDGIEGASGTMTPANSLVGDKEFDNVGQEVTALTNGNYVVTSRIWTNGANQFAGAATWGDGTFGVQGAVSPANSLVGSSTGANVGLFPAVALPNGNYVLATPFWANGAVPFVGAITWGNGMTGITGTISSTNSLVGATAGDALGVNFVPPNAFELRVTALPNSNYVVGSPLVDTSATITDTGAVTLGNGEVGTTGDVEPPASVLGTAHLGGPSMNSTFNPTHEWLAVGRPADNIVSIIFSAQTLNVAVAGSGEGEVESTPAAIACGITCTAEIVQGAVITLTATADVSSIFTGWSGDCTGVGGCTVPMTQTRNVTATFAIKTFNLTVQKVGDGTGTVTGAPANPITYGTVVTLTATADPGSNFDSWSGACSGEGTCSVVMTEARSVTATFDRNRYALTVNTAGAGSGTVTGAPANPIDHGTVVTLTATAAAGNTFGGWSGDCDGFDLCVLTMDSAKTVTATFLSGVFHLLTINTAGTGSGSVTGAPANPIAGGTVVTLTAQAAAGSVFAGWSGACTGSALCVLTMDSAKTVTATFTLSGGGNVEVDIAPAGDGGDLVVEVVSNTVQAGAMSAPVTVGQTNESYPIGTVLRITAVAWLGYAFDGWGGDASGAQNPLEITVTEAITISAAFAVADVFLPAVGR